MKGLLELKQMHKAALDKAESFLGTTDHVMTPAENENFAAAMAEAKSIEETIQARERMTTLRASLPNPAALLAGGERQPVSASPFTAWRTSEYHRDFAAYLRSRGKVATESMSLGFDPTGGGFKFPATKIQGAAYEGNAADGGPLVQLITEQQIVPLAPPEMGIESLATVIPTTQNLKFPRKTAHGAGAYKAEGTGSGANLFTGTDPSMDSFELSAYMIGHPEDVSWELVQDIPVFQSFATQDILLSLAILKEAWYWSGTGTNQAQGIKGNIGAGVTAQNVITAGSGDNYGSALIDATFDVQGALNAVYHPNASFLLARATSVFIRKAQKQANLFEPVFVRAGKQDYLHGYPVTYSTSVDNYGTVNNVPVVFGDFKAGYLIGVRGGAGINIKILDQPKALEGLLTVLGYQRLDGRVRRSEALQPIIIGS